MEKMEINTIRNVLQQFKDHFSEQHQFFIKIETSMNIFSAPSSDDVTEFLSEIAALDILGSKKLLDPFLAGLQTKYSNWLYYISQLRTAFSSTDHKCGTGKITFTEVKDHIQSAIINFDFLKENQCIQHLKTARLLATQHVQARNSNSSAGMRDLCNIDISQLENVKSILDQLTPQFFQECMKALVEVCCKGFQNAMQSSTQQTEQIQDFMDSLGTFALQFRPRFLNWLEEISLLQIQIEKYATFHPFQQVDISEIRRNVQSALGLLYFLQEQLPNCTALLRADAMQMLTDDVLEFTKLIYQKHSLYFVLHPRSVMQIKTATTNKNRNTGNSSTKINMAIQLLTVGNMRSQENISIQVEIKLINDDSAQQSLRSQPGAELNVNSAGSLINLCTPPMNALPQIITSMEGREMGYPTDEGYIAKSFNKNLAIAVKNVDRTRTVQVDSDKYYFQAVARIQLPGFFQNGGSPVTIQAQALSLPMYLGTNTSQDKLHKSASLYRCFPVVHTNPTAELREKASIVEIRRVMQHHFVEWTYVQRPTKNSNRDHVYRSLVITDLQLDSLMNMFLQLVCNEMNIREPAELLGAEIPLKYLYKEELMGVGNERFTFFSWYFEAVHLLRNQFLRKHWSAGNILGTISKQESVRKLCSFEVRPIGMFLIRFSESVKRDLVIDYVRFDGNIRSKQMNIDQSGAPQIQKKFLECITMDTWTGTGTEETYKTLYPGIPKSDAFQLPPKSETRGGRSGYDSEKTFIDLTKKLAQVTVA